MTVTGVCTENGAIVQCPAVLATGPETELAAVRSPSLGARSVLGHLRESRSATRLLVDVSFCAFNPLALCFFCAEYYISMSKKHEDMYILNLKTSSTEFEIIGIDGKPTFDQLEGVLLFEGGTVCADGFTNLAADAVCRHMGHHAAISWRHGILFRYLEIL